LKAVSSAEHESSWCGGEVAGIGSEGWYHCSTLGVFSSEFISWHNNTILSGLCDMNAVMLGCLGLHLSGCYTYGFRLLENVGFLFCNIWLLVLGFVVIFRGMILSVLWQQILRIVF